MMEETIISNTIVQGASEGMTTNKEEKEMLEFLGMDSIERLFGHKINRKTEPYKPL